MAIIINGLANGFIGLVNLVLKGWNTMASLMGNEEVELFDYRPTTREELAQYRAKNQKEKATLVVNKNKAQTNAQASTPMPASTLSQIESKTVKSTTINDNKSVKITIVSKDPNKAGESVTQAMQDYNYDQNAASFGG